MGLKKIKSLSIFYSLPESKIQIRVPLNQGSSHLLSQGGANASLGFAKGGHFHSNNLLTIHNIYKYHCIVELFKVIKLRTPMSIYELMKRSERQGNYFISLPPSSLFDYQASNFWSKCRKSNSKIDFTTSIKIVKTKLKICLLETHNRHDMFVWHEFNFDTDHLHFDKSFHTIYT